MASIEQSRLLECSFDINDQMGNLERTKIGIDTDFALQVALLTLRRYAPEIMGWGKERVHVKAEHCFAVDEEVSEYPDGSFSGILGNLSLQKIHREEDDGLITLNTSRVDLCLGFRPEILDPDPVDLVFGKEIIVPLGAVEMLER